MQKEYWVNVYEAYGQKWYGHPQTLIDSNSLLSRATHVIYRIHVKMKNVKPLNKMSSAEVIKYGKIHDSWFLY